MCCARHGVFDLVPVDYVNNMLIAIGWITALNKCVCVSVENDRVSIYNSQL